MEQNPKHKHIYSELVNNYSECRLYLKQLNDKYIVPLIGNILSTEDHTSIFDLIQIFTKSFAQLDIVPPVHHSPSFYKTLSTYLQDVTNIQTNVARLVTTNKDFRNYCVANNYDIDVYILAPYNWVIHHVQTLKRLHSVSSQYADLRSTLQENIMSFEKVLSKFKSYIKVLGTSTLIHIYVWIALCNIEKVQECVNNGVPINYTALLIAYFNGFGVTDLLKKLIVSIPTFPEHRDKCKVVQLRHSEFIMSFPFITRSVNKIEHILSEFKKVDISYVPNTTNVVQLEKINKLLVQLHKISKEVYTPFEPEDHEDFSIIAQLPDSEHSRTDDTFDFDQHMDQTQMKEESQASEVSEASGVSEVRDELLSLIKYDLSYCINNQMIDLELIKHGLTDRLLTDLPIDVRMDELSLTIVHNLMSCTAPELEQVINAISMSIIEHK